MFIHLPLIHFTPPPCLLVDFKNSKWLTYFCILLCICYCFSHLIGLLSVTWLLLLYKFTQFFIHFLFLSDEGPMFETLDYTIRIGSTPTFLYFDLFWMLYLVFIPRRHVLCRILVYSSCKCYCRSGAVLAKNVTDANSVTVCLGECCSMSLGKILNLYRTSETPFAWISVTFSANFPACFLLNKMQNQRYLI